MPSFAIPSICNQRRQIALFNKPGSRTELVFPPSGFTTFQLDMRRKAEILQYNANKSNTKTNNPTKAERWAALSKNNNSQGLSQHFLTNTNPAIPICPNDISLSTPTSSSDVPGPVIYLHYDASVPLYNYATNNHSYGVINREDTTPWIVYSSTDMYFPDSIDTTLMFVEFKSLANTGIYLFNISTPISIYVEGNGAGNPNSNIVEFQISSIVASIYYSGQLVTTIPVSTSQSIFSRLVEFNTNSLSTQGFYVAQYVGMLNLTGFALSIAPGFVYEFRLNFTIGSNISTQGLINNLQTGVYVNISSANVSDIKGVTMISSPSLDPLYPQTFSSSNY
jgi:hypothetical protein